MLQPPQQGQNVDELWRKVAELTAVMNAMMTMDVVVNNPSPTTGRLLFTGDRVTLVLE